MQRAKIVNLNRNAVLARAIIANNPWLRIRGLLGKKSLEEGDGILIKPCKQIHSFFMQFNFDAVFLNKDLRVVHVIEDMAAWKISPYISDAASVLELPAGTVSRTETKEGDTAAIRIL